jgi:hypothetical protein
MTDHPGAVLTTPSGLTISLSRDEAQLALLGLVDFEGHWDALQAATAFVVDGPAKAAIIRERLCHLPALLGFGVDSLEMLAARHWFRARSCSQAIASQTERTAGK